MIYASASIDKREASVPQRRWDHDLIKYNYRFVPPNMNAFDLYWHEASQLLDHEQSFYFAGSICIVLVPVLVHESVCFIARSMLNIFRRVQDQIDLSIIFRPGNYPLFVSYDTFLQIRVIQFRAKIYSYCRRRSRERVKCVSGAI